ncbi:MAG: MBL fold metallo-hydrolase [Candidatus Thiodiazotropha sp. (ex Lucina pensylvanica)]|nr:MBL fold metallo-hydrolase [Candidatus Thiodiazotropha sp. (ex Lucina pensylvanica)]
MDDFYELDFWNTESDCSGDAISFRSCRDDQITIHVTDAGFQSSGDTIVSNIRKYYDNPAYIDHVVVSHPDGDHAGGLRSVLEEFTIGNLWMLRPWIYAEAMIDRFENYSSVPHLKGRLKRIYPNIAALEEIALNKGIPIHAPFQGTEIGEFLVLSPSLARYIDLVVTSEKTPEHKEERGLLDEVFEAIASVVSLVFSPWGNENFSEEETSAENEMSIIQYTNFMEHRVLLTADAGRTALSDAIEYSLDIGIDFPGLDVFQVPHHGSRRNVSSEILDELLGTKLGAKLFGRNFTGVVCASQKDKDHPRKAVTRAIYHRGGEVQTTERNNYGFRKNIPVRPGWGPVDPVPYPEDQEE